MVASARTYPEPIATPFLKWVGGKRQLLSDILPRLPRRIHTYYEPFIGGGAVFFALASQDRFDRAVISDRNTALVEAYRVVRDDVEGLIAALERHADHATDSDYFYAVRAIDTETLSEVERAARLLFLNKTCFNGLYRVNKRGLFNVPFGRYKNPRVLDETNLRTCSALLRGVEILESDFGDVAKRAGRGDAIYFDPPYVPISATSSFTAYAKHPFGPKEHERLARAYTSCVRRGAVAMLSNSDCPVTRELYDGFEVETVKATRAINSVASRRGAIDEVLVVGLTERLRRPLTVVETNDSALPAAAERKTKKKLA